MISILSFFYKCVNRLNWSAKDCRDFNFVSLIILIAKARVLRTSFSCGSQIPTSLKLFEGTFSYSNRFWAVTVPPCGGSPPRTWYRLRNILMCGDQNCIKKRGDIRFCITWIIFVNVFCVSCPVGFFEVPARKKAEIRLARMDSEF